MREWAARRKAAREATEALRKKVLEKKVLSKEVTATEADATCGWRLLFGTGTLDLPTTEVASQLRDAPAIAEEKKRSSRSGCARAQLLQQRGGWRARRGSQLETLKHEATVIASPCALAGWLRPPGEEQGRRGWSALVKVSGRGACQ